MLMKMSCYSPQGQSQGSRNWRAVVQHGAVLALLFLVTACPASMDATAQGPKPGPSANNAELLACAGPDLVVKRASLVRMDSTCSRVLDSELRYDRVWRQTGGERVSMQSAVSPQSQFFAPLGASVLDFSLNLSAPLLDSQDSSRVSVLPATSDQQTAPVPPLALSRGDLILAEAETRVSLDASPSIGQEGPLQIFRWSQLIGPPAQLSASDAAICDAVFAAPPQLAVFAVQVQSASGLWSEPDFVVVRGAETAVDERPDSASLRGPQFSQPGQEISLRLGPSIEATSGIVRNLRQVRGDPCELQQRDPDTVQFVAPLRPQILAFRLDVESQGQRAAPALLWIEVGAGLGNHAPIADAGPDRQVRPSQEIAISAQLSTDPDGDSIQDYRWTQLSGAPFALTCQAANCVGQSPAEPGVAVFELVVSDGVAESESDILLIEIDAEASNQAPIADAGGERWAQLGAEVVLDGSLSRDPDSGQIAQWLWQQVDQGDHPVVFSDGENRAQVHFVAPTVATDLHFSLRVCDNDQACASDQMVLHVAAAGPYVDPARGSEQGRGTVEDPYAQLDQALMWSQRFAINELHLAAGSVLVNSALTLPPGFSLRGGYLFSDQGYQWAQNQTTLLQIPGLDAITLKAGAALKDLSLQGIPSTSEVSTRHLIVLEADNLLQGVTATGPSNAEQSDTVWLQAGASAQINQCALWGGQASGESNVINAQAGSRVRIFDSQVFLGSGDQVRGLFLSDAALEAVGLEVQSHPEQDAPSLVGIELHNGQATFTQLHVDLRNWGTAPAPQKVTALYGENCVLSVDDQSRLYGAGPLAADGSSFGIDLLQPLQANISGVLVGGSGESAGEYTAMQVQGGHSALIDTLVQATDSAGLTSLAVGLSVQGGQIEVLNTQVSALAQQHAVGLAFCALDAAHIDISQLNVAATVSLGLSDGRPVRTDEVCTPSSQLSIALDQAQLVGTSDSTGLLMQGSNSPLIQLGPLRVTGVRNSTGLSLMDCLDPTISASEIEVISASHGGQSTGVQCASEASVAPELTMTQTWLHIQGEQCLGLSSPSCKLSAINDAIDIDADHMGQGLALGEQGELNTCLVQVSAVIAYAISLAEPGRLNNLRNSVLLLDADEGAIFLSPASHLGLVHFHHAALVHPGLALLKQDDTNSIADVQALLALRPDYYALMEFADPNALGLDADGRIVSSDSPLVDAADPTSTPTTDIDGQHRPQGQGPDLGPDEAF